MGGDRQRRDIGDDPAEDPPDRARLAVADRVGEDDPVGAGLGDLAGDAAHPVLVDIALDRAAEGGREAAIDLHLLAAVAAQPDHAAEILDRLVGRAADVRDCGRC